MTLFFISEMLIIFSMGLIDLVISFIKLHIPLVRKPSSSFFFFVVVDLYDLKEETGLY